MKKLIICLLIGSVICCISLMALKSKPVTFNFPSYDPNFPPPPGYPNPFSLSQDYPDTYDAGVTYSWQAIDFKTDPVGYMKTVLKYDLEGNIDADFVVQNNNVRKWYHAPWLHDDSRKGGNGREYMHGLTRERATPIKELHDDQDVPLENWAVGFYNEPGGYTIGQVWKNGTSPSVKNNAFPEGTSTFKLLFTDGTVDKVPFLKGSKEWTANIYPCDPAKCGQRINRAVRLLQIDIAVKDRRSLLTGWVFGTFIYDSSAPGTTVWDRMVPVGLSWGDDSGIPDMINRPGSFINPKLTQTFLNSALVKNVANDGGNKAYMNHFGLGGRLNGPVDNRVASCISCHGRAANLPNGQPASLGNFNTSIEAYPLNDFNKYFATISGGDGPLIQNGKTFTKTDYSLQLTYGIRNYYQHQHMLASSDSNRMSPAARKKALKQTPDLKLVTRGGN